MSHDIGVWISAILTLFVFSFLYKDTLFYRLAEHIFVGVSAAWLFATSIHAQLIEDMLMKAFPHAFHQSSPPEYIVLGGGIIGLAILSRLIPGFISLSRWGVAFLVGFQTGIQLFDAISANILLQLGSTIVPLFNRPLGELIKNWLSTIGTTSSLAYFYFSKEHKGALGVVTRIGIWFLMISFGAAYGSTVMTRMSILITRIHFLLSTWLGVVHG